MWPVYIKNYIQNVIYIYYHTWLRRIHHHRLYILPIPFSILSIVVSWIYLIQLGTSIYILKSMYPCLTILSYINTVIQYNIAYYVWILHFICLLRHPQTSDLATHFACDTMVQAEVFACIAAPCHWLGTSWTSALRGASFDQKTIFSF